MSLSREIYTTLEAIVGAKNISDKEYILAGNRNRTPEYPFDYHSADAIIMPGSTEEVRDIIRICNQNDLCFVTEVSGVSADAFPNRAGTLLIDLKRMNQIIEINTEDCYAVIEPGVRHVQLYPELRRQGFTYAVAAVGPGGSVLSNFTSTAGENHNMYGASRANRYLLGMEWVTPEGEILRTGSLQTGSGWFCPDGPGPSFRGLLRGFYGSHGQMGIITKAAIALLPCKGPRKIVSEGHSPNHRVYQRSEKGQVYLFNCRNLDAAREMILRMGEVEIASTITKFFYLTLAVMMTEDANALHELWPRIRRELPIPLVVHLAPESAEELAYEERLLFEIAEETGCDRAASDLEDWYRSHMDFFMVAGMLQRVLRLGGGWMPIKLGADSVSHMFEVGKTIPEFIYKYTENGTIFDAPDNFQIAPMEYGHFAYIELLFMYDRTNPEVGKGVAEFRQASRDTDLAHHFHAETLGCLNATAELLGPLYCNYHLWLRKLKSAFDPNNLANPILKE
ncbi:MAG: FAD-binding oxidoreductase [Lachnospiraceae bacterium]|nr:FAD-binding oxidoreductase [Lachnospiraceae bacterium]